MTFSIRHLLLASFILVFFSLAVGNLIDPDLWWHLRTGQYIVETRTIPHSDVFSYTRPGSEWVAHEWLSEVIMYVTYSAFGAGGLILLIAILSTLAFGLLFLRDTSHLLTAGAALLLSSLTAWPLFTPRPWLFSALLASAYLYVLDAYARFGKTRLLRVLPFLMVLWVNLHGGFSLGLVIIALYALGFLVEDILEKRPSSEIRTRLMPLALTFGASALAVLFNPNGARMYTYPFETLGSSAMQKLITEWFSPDFHNLNMQPFAAQLLITFGLLALSQGRARARDVLIAAVFAYAGLYASRNILFFSLASLPIIIASLGRLFERSSPWRWLDSPSVDPRVITAMNLVVLLVLMSSLGVYVSQVIEHQPQLQLEAYPDQAATFIVANHPPSPLFNTYDWGGYLIWRLYPDYRVFIDGRADVYSDQFFKAYAEAMNDPIGGRALLDQYQVRTAIIPTDNALGTALSDDPDWLVIYKDRVAVVLTKK